MMRIRSLNNDEMMFQQAGWNAKNNYFSIVKPQDDEEEETEDDYTDDEW